MTDTTTDQGDERRTQPWYDLAIKSGVAIRISHAGDEVDALTFSPTEFEAFCAAFSDARPVAQEAIAWSLRFDDDPRLNLSTVFDTEDEAKEYATRCGSATPVPLFAAPQPSQGAIGTFNCPICGNGTPHHHSDFEQVQAMSEEQIDAELRALGIDPDKAAQKVKAVIDQCCAEYDRRLKNPLAASQTPQIEGILRKDAAHQLASIARKYGSTSTHDRAGLMAAMRDAYLLGQGVEDDPYHERSMPFVKRVNRPSEAAAVSGDVSKTDREWTEFCRPYVYMNGSHEMPNYAAICRAVLALAGSGGKARG